MKVQSGWPKLSFSILVMIGTSLGCNGNAKAAGGGMITGKPFATAGVDSELSGMEDLAITEPAAAQQDLVRMDKKYFVIYYDKGLRLPQVSAYVLTADHLRSAFVKRQNRFHADDELEAMGEDPVRPSHYLKSGYDRGHQAPSGDFTWSEEANDTTFLMSNMAPQTPRLNRIAWEALEARVRSWACAAGSVIVLTGPILKGKLGQLASGVNVPDKFFKIVIDKKPPMKAIGFVLSQDDGSRKDYLDRHMPIKDIEEMAGLSFLDNMSQAERDKIENDDDMSKWSDADCSQEKNPQIIQSINQPGAAKPVPVLSVPAQPEFGGQVP